MFDNFRGFFYAALPRDTVSCRNSEILLPCTRLIQSQAAWWIRRISLHMSLHAPFPFWRPLRPASEIDLFPDAAGISPVNPRLGCGVFIDLPQPVIFYMAWPDFIKNNSEVAGCGHVGAKLSFLEAVAALCAVIADPASITAKVVTIHSDNLGLVLAWRKGSSRCLLTYSIILALKKLESALCLRLDIVKVPRCSSPQSSVADMLSKGLLQQVWKLFPHRRMQPGDHSSSLFKWLCNPFPTRVLGSAIVKELAYKYNVVDCDFELEDEVLPLIHFNHDI